MNQGILTLALNKPSYLALAANLAATIKAADYGAGVALITNLDPGHYAALFDKVIYIDDHNPFQVKTQLYGLTPFKRTLFIDADSVLTSQVLDKVWATLDNLKLSFPVLGVYDSEKPAPLSWVNLPAFSKWAKFNGQYPALYSGAFFFAKSKEANNFFRSAASLYGSYPDCESIGIYYPDEPFFSMAAAKKGLLFGEMNSFIYKADSPTCNETEILRYCFLTMPGKPNREHVRLYNAIISRAGRLGFPVTRYQK